MAGNALLSVTARVASSDAAKPRLDVTIEADAGITAVMGPSGAGKSTLLAAIAGLLKPDAGRIALGDDILFDREAGTFVPPHRRRVALVFQSLALFPHLSAWENVAYGLPKSGAPARERAMAWLARAHADHVADRLPETFSGGEAQRVAIARALASEPRALLLDEPLSAMDDALRVQLRDEIQRLVAEVAIPTLWVTHDRNDAAVVGERVIELEAGRVRA
jgi:molybdate transport system ATP-binding protein